MESFKLWFQGQRASTVNRLTVSRQVVTVRGGQWIGSNSILPPERSDRAHLRIGHGRQFQSRLGQASLNERVKLKTEHRVQFPAGFSRISVSVSTMVKQRPPIGASLVSLCFLDAFWPFTRKTRTSKRGLHGFLSNTVSRVSSLNLTGLRTRRWKSVGPGKSHRTRDRFLWETSGPRKRESR